MRFRLRSLLILMAIAPPLAAWAWTAYREHVRQMEQMRQERFRLLMTISIPLLIGEEEEFTSGIQPSEP